MFLTDRDVPCPGCGYNLRGIAQARCPECERAVALCIDGTISLPRERTEAVVLLWFVLLATLAQIGLWFATGVLFAGLPGWIVAGTLITVAVQLAECAVLVRLILTLRRSSLSTSRRLMIRWALIWLTAHTAAAWASVAVNVLFMWLY